MPLARGLMQIGRLSYFNTTTTYNISEPPTYTCGETIHFNVTVTNNQEPTPVPTGTVQLFDSNSSTVIGTGTLSGGSVTIPVTISTGTLNVVANYLGTNTSPFFNISSSAPTIVNVSLISTGTAVTAPSSGLNFCFQTILNPVVANVTSGSGSPSGTVQFNLYINNTSFSTFSTATLSGGFAVTALPSEYTTPGSSYWINAVYVGGGCFQASSSPTGTAGVQINSIELDPTATANPTITLHGGGAVPADFCFTTAFDISVTTTATQLVAPSTGTTQLFASQTSGTYATPFVLASGTPSSGHITFSNVTFPAAGTGEWFIQAVYTDGACYNLSASHSGTSGTVLQFMFDDTSSNAATTTAFVAPSSGTVIELGNGLDIVIEVQTADVGTIESGEVTLYFAFSASHTPPSDFPFGWTVNSFQSITPGDPFITFALTSSFFSATGSYYFIAIYNGTPCYGSSNTSLAGTEAFEITVIS